MKEIDERGGVGYVRFSPLTRLRKAYWNWRRARANRWAARWYENHFKG